MNKKLFARRVLTGVAGLVLLGTAVLTGWAIKPDAAPLPSPEQPKYGICGAPQENGVSMAEIVDTDQLRPLVDDAIRAHGDNAGKYDLSYQVPIADCAFVLSMENADYFNYDNSDILSFYVFTLHVNAEKNGWELIDSVRVDLKASVALRHANEHSITVTKP